MNRLKAVTLFGALALLLVAGGCTKKTPVAPPPPTPPAKQAQTGERGPAAVINSFKADPSTVIRGESATLSWSVSNATEVVIDNGIGSVQPNGSRRVSPNQAITYRMTAKGLGGDAVAAVTINVTTAPAPPPPPPAPKASLNERMSKAVQDVFFDYDQSEVREDARATLQRNSDGIKAILNDFPSVVITIEGHCDERGSAEYNLGLGDRRANSVKEFLAQIGVPEERLKTISFGKEKPFCMDSTEDCYAQNRRAHFAAVQ